MGQKESAVKYWIVTLNRWSGVDIEEWNNEVTREFNKAAQMGYRYVDCAMIPLGRPDYHSEAAQVIFIFEKVE